MSWYGSLPKAAKLICWGYLKLVTFIPCADLFVLYAQLLRHKKAYQKLSVGREKLALGAKQFMKLAPGVDFIKELGAQRKA